MEIWCQTNEIKVPLWLSVLSSLSNSGLIHQKKKNLNKYVLLQFFVAQTSDTCTTNRVSPASRTWEGLFVFDRLHGNLPISAIEFEKKCTKKQTNKQ